MHSHICSRVEEEGDPTFDLIQVYHEFVNSSTKNSARFFARSRGENMSKIVQFC